MMHQWILAVTIAWVAAGSSFGAKIVLIAGGGDGADGSPALTAKVVQPFGVDFDTAGRLYFVEMTKGERLRIVESDGTLHTVAGTGQKGAVENDIPALKATFNGPHSLAIDPFGNVLIADTFNNCIRAYSVRQQRVSRYLGTSEKGYAGDGGTAAKVQFGGVYCIGFDPKKEFLFIADLDNRRIRRWDVSGRTGLTTVAGNGKKGVPADGRKAVDEPLVDPRACATDGDGNVYILERGGHSLRVVDKAGIIRTVAGTGQKGAKTGKALDAQMNGPKHLCVDRDGSVLIADTENHRILRFSPKEKAVAVVAGTGKKGDAGLDGDPLQCELNQPHGVTINPKTGELCICDSSNHRILKIVE